MGSRELMEASARAEAARRSQASFEDIPPSVERPPTVRSWVLLATCAAILWGASLTHDYLRERRADRDLAAAAHAADGVTESMPAKP